MEQYQELNKKFERFRRIQFEVAYQYHFEVYQFLAIAWHCTPERMSQQLVK